MEALNQAQARSAPAASLNTLDSNAASGGGGGSTSAACGAEPLSVEEEGELLKYYSSRLQHICRELRLPRRVPGAAVAYLKRIYLAHSCLEQDPQQLLLTCLYLACKIEEHYISAAELGRLTGAPAEVILRTELTALQALKFDLITYSPYKAIEGFIEDIKDAAAAAAEGGGDGDAVAAAAGLDAGMAGLSEEQVSKAKQAAMSAADALMMSDAPLLHTPGRLALAALRSGFSKLGIKLQRYVQRVAQRSSGGGEGGDAPQQQLQQLQAALAELDQLGAQGAKAVDQARVVALNQRLKSCRMLLMEGSGQAGAKAKAKAGKQAHKAAKVAEQRGAAGATLDVQAMPASDGGGEQPAAKRWKQAD